MTGESIREQLWDAADPDGSQRTLLDAAASMGRAPGWLQLLGRSIDVSWTQLAELGTEQAALMDLMEAAVRVLVPRGWAAMHMDTAAVNAAVVYWVICLVLSTGQGALERKLDRYVAH